MFVLWIKWRHWGFLFTYSCTFKSVTPKVSFLRISENDTFESAILESVKIESVRVDRHPHWPIIPFPMGFLTHIIGQKWVHTRHALVHSLILGRVWPVGIWETVDNTCHLCEDDLKQITWTRFCRNKKQWVT